MLLTSEITRAAPQFGGKFQVVSMERHIVWLYPVPLAGRGLVKSQVYRVPAIWEVVPSAFVPEKTSDTGILVASKQASQLKYVERGVE
jgi:hypothetical protein